MDAVLLDTCVLLKSYLCDTLLSIAEGGTFRPLWSDHVLEELRRNLIKARAKPEAAEHRLDDRFQAVSGRRQSATRMAGRPVWSPPPTRRRSTARCPWPTRASVRYETVRDSSGRFVAVACRHAQSSGSQAQSRSSSCGSPSSCRESTEFRWYR